MRWLFAIAVTGALMLSGCSGDRTPETHDESWEIIKVYEDGRIFECLAWNGAGSSSAISCEEVSP